MEEQREGDCRFPLISSLLCIFVGAGGILLFIYVFKPSLSRPWFPVTSFLLIGSPWIFWVLTYTYTCIKACVRNRRLYDHQISRRTTSSSHARSTAASTHNNNNNNKNAKNQESPSAVNNDHSERSGNGDGDDDGKRVHFGGVVVMDQLGHGGRNPRPDGQNSSVTSSREIEMPLKLSVSS